MNQEGWGGGPKHVTLLIQTATSLMIAVGFIFISFFPSIAAS